MSGEFSEFDESAPARQADKDPATGHWSPERAHAFEQYPDGNDCDLEQRTGMEQPLGELVLNDGWGEQTRSDETAPPATEYETEGAADQREATLDDLAMDDGWDEPVSSGYPPDVSRDVDAGPTPGASSTAEARQTAEDTASAETKEARDVEFVRDSNADGADGDGWGVELRPQASTPAKAEGRRVDSTETSPVAADAISERTDANRIALADDVRAIELKPTYDGYLDVVMHGDESGTQADVKGERIDFTLPQTAEMIESSPSWERRPIRLLSCSTGQDAYAQELADRLRVPVYAPNGVLEVSDDGMTSIDSPDGVAAGAWRRFEPRQ